LPVACSSRPPVQTPAARAAPPARPAPTLPPPWSPTERARLDRSLGSILGDDILVNDTGIAVVAADGQTLFARRATIPVAPASTLKLVVAATALDVLGPAYRFATRFVTDQPPDATGALTGALWLVGGGDPSLTSDDLRRGVGTLARSGIRQIDGPLEVDDGAFSGPEQNPRWEADDLDYDYAAGTSAISVDDGVVEFDVVPDPAGGAAHVKTVPENDAVSLSGSVATVSAAGDSDVSIDRTTPLPSFGSVASAGSSDASSEPRIEFTLDGQIAQGETQKFYKPVLGMAGYVGGAVAAMLAERDIALAGGYRTGTPPFQPHLLWQHQSATLDRLVREMLVDSNNHTAETLLRKLGEANGRAGSDAAGLAVERRELDRLRVPREGLTLYDGSGLAPDDRIMPLTLAKLLSAEARGPNGPTYVRALPLVGLEGTVKHHDLHAALGRTRAKSGHIENVNGLAGTVMTRTHGRVAFAIVVNDPRADADVVTIEEDRALDALAGF
jgi:D-alanyl-D-alanine carboxypeptidase/D-alanyl-D-alanine-endopeptidase (penicillin-binding protein 4)